jgi:hypothetical protein
MLMSQRNTGDAPEGGQDLGHDAVVEDLRLAGAGGGDRLDLGVVGLLDRLVEQLADEADRAEADGEDAGEQAGAEDGSPAAAPRSAS